MRLPRVRLTTKLLMILVAIAALVIHFAPGIYDRFAGPRFNKTYYVGDFLSEEGSVVGSPTSKAELSEQAVVLKSSVTPYAWWLADRSVTPSSSNLTLTVRHTEAGHEQVGAWLREKRRRLYFGKP
jgi:hypothetical protein